MRIHLLFWAALASVSSLSASVPTSSLISDSGQNSDSSLRSDSSRSPDSVLNSDSDRISDPSRSSGSSRSSDSGRVTDPPQSSDSGRNSDSGRGSDSYRSPDSALSSDSASAANGSPVHLEHVIKLEAEFKSWLDSSGGSTAAENGDVDGLVEILNQAALLPWPLLSSEMERALIHHREALRWEVRQVWAKSRALPFWLGELPADEHLQLELLELLKEPGKQKDEALTALTQARQWFAQGHLEEAAARYRSIPQNSGIWPDALREQAWAHLLLGRPAQALGATVSLSAPFFALEEHAEGKLLRAHVFLERCRFNEARAVVKELAELKLPDVDELRLAAVWQDGGAGAGDEDADFWNRAMLHPLVSRTRQVLTTHLPFDALQSSSSKDFSDSESSENTRSSRSSEWIGTSNNEVSLNEGASEMPDTIEAVDIQASDIQAVDIRADDIRTDDLRTDNLRSGHLRAQGLRDGNRQTDDLQDGNLRTGELRAGNRQDGDLRDDNRRDDVRRVGDFRDDDSRASDRRGTDLRDSELRAGDFRDDDSRASDRRGNDLREDELRPVDLLHSTGHPDIFDIASVARTAISEPADAFSAADSSGGSGRGLNSRPAPSSNSQLFSEAVAASRQAAISPSASTPHSAPSSDLLAQKRQELENLGIDFLARAARQEREALRRMKERALRIRYEAIRGQRAFMESSAQSPRPVKPSPELLDDDEVAWSFDGHFWRDELGSYRYTAADACPTGGMQ